MENGFFLITGTSQGIGEALAGKVLQEGNTVLGVSRNRSDRLKATKYHHLSFDLNQTAQISRIMEKVDDIVAKQGFDFACLVNNASAIEPLGSIERCAAAEIEAHVRIGLVAPMILTSLFIDRFSKDRIRKKVAFISSGLAFTAIPDGSVYCSSKAALNMFAQCVGLEQQKRKDGFEVVSIGPGMVDTSMQRTTRSKSPEEFAWAGFFKQAYADGRVHEPGEVAEKIYAILEGKYEQGKFVSVNQA